MTVQQITDVIECPFIVVKDGHGDQELFNSLHHGADLPPDVAVLPVHGIRTANLPLFTVIVIDVWMEGE